MSIQNEAQAKVGTLQGTNIITDLEGRTYHVGVKSGEVANRVILVGELSRAERLAELLDGAKLVGTTHRAFHTFTGTFQDTPVSIISIGMGLAMMDFAVREIAQVTKGDLCMVRIGTCGTINASVPIGTLALAKQSVSLQTNYSNFEHSQDNCYLVGSRVLSASESLHRGIEQELSKQHVAFVSGLDITCDGFYATQGRHDVNFDDRNERLIEQLQTRFPGSVSLQMETYQLFHLADIVRRRRIHCTAAAIVLAQRNSTHFLQADKKQTLEQASGLAVLNALHNFPLS